MDDLISRKWLVRCVEEGWIKFDTEKDENRFMHLVRDIAPSVQPYTEAEIQKMQDLEQAELQKAYECGRASAQPEIIHCGDCRHWKNDHLCECLSRYGTFETEIYFYCGFAERREE